MEITELDKALAFLPTITWGIFPKIEDEELRIILYTLLGEIKDATDKAENKLYRLDHGFV